MRILIVDNEKLICEQRRRYFVDKGFTVDVAHTATDGEHMSKEYPVDAIIIDVGLPDFSGIELIKRLRQYHVKVPILILTKSSQEKVEGLNAGADYCVTKPFKYTARINALAHPELTYNDLVTINTVAQEIFLAGLKIESTAHEYNVLKYLLFHKGKGK